MFVIEYRFSTSAFDDDDDDDDENDDDDNGDAESHVRGCDPRNHTCVSP